MYHITKKAEYGFQGLGKNRAALNAIMIKHEREVERLSLANNFSVFFGA